MDKQEAQEAIKQLEENVLAKLGEEVAGVVDAKMIEATKALRDIPEAKDEEAAEWEQTVKAFKAQYQKDIFGEVEKDLTTGGSGTGAELIPTAFGNEVIRVAQQVGVARREGRVITLPAKVYKLPGFGNVTAYRTDEASGYTASGLSTSQLTFTAKKLTAMVIATRETIEDANVDVIRWIANLAGEAIALKEDTWAFLGLGSGEGIFQTSGVPEYQLATGANTDAYTDTTLDDLLSTLNLVDDGVVDTVKWLGSFSMYNHYRSLKDDNGRYLLQDPAQGNVRTIWGLPYVLSSVMPKTTDASQPDTSCLALFDGRYLMIGDRRTIEVEFSKEATVTSSDGSTAINLFEQDMVAIKVSERLDIQLAEPTKAFAKLTVGATS